MDDQPANLQVLGALLGRLGHDVVPVADGPTALKRLALRPPDLVLLDLLMPDMDGFEVCRRIREQPAFADLPVIFLSAADDKGLIVRAFESGGVDYVTKPFNQAELTSRVQTHLALKAARDRLRQLAEDKDELLGILTHDLKNHLGGLHLSAALLRDRLEATEPRLAILARNMVDGSGRMLGFVQEFLANAAVDHALAVQPAGVDAQATATQVVRLYADAAARKELRLETRWAEGLPAALADAAALRQVLENLVSNAIKFSPAGRAVTVTTRAVAEGVEVEVRDEGPGLTEMDRAGLFRRYCRLSARPTAGEPSTGLGLSIAHRLVTAMGGEIFCDSVPGQGAAFRVRLKAAP
ncbi:MAG: response regulator [Limisphaerales bacterium]